jgi:hypothetical protein
MVTLRRGHEVYEMVKDVHVVLGKGKRNGKNTKKMTCEKSK